MSTVRCGRLDRHAPHEHISNRLTDGYRLPWTAEIVDCPGVVTIEGGALDVHDCGARVQPAEVRECCSRCTGTVCPECEPCRRVS